MKAQKGYTTMQGYTVVELLICLWALVCVGVVGTLLYVAGHFISKFW